MANEQTNTRIPPQNLEAEQSLLGAILIDREAIVRIIDVVQPDDFYRDAHERVFAAMRELYSKSEPIDALSLANRLEERGDLERVGGRQFLASLTSSVPTSAHVKSYAEIVRRKATLRRLITAGANITEIGYQEEVDIDETLDNAEQALFGVTQKYLAHIFLPLKSLLGKAWERVEQLHQQGGKLRGVATGFRELDEMLAGLQPSDLIILAARPSVGKTSLALDIARNVASKKKVPVGIFSLEMSKEQLVDRLLCAEANVDLWKLRTGRLTDKGEDDDFTKINAAMGTLDDAPIYIDDAASTNVMEIRARARRLQMEQGLGLLIIDYLQLMEAHNRSDSRVQEISQISRALKQLARELSIPVIALSQLSRAVEARSPAIPKLADLRESGAIEQDADVVLFIYRKSADRSLRDVPLEEKNIAQIRVEKHRNGPTGVIDLYFDDAQASFHNLERHATTEGGDGGDLPQF